jgi:hypothetical protein
MERINGVVFVEFHEHKHLQIVIMLMWPAGLGTKNDCAGEDQKQFIRPTDCKALTVTLFLRGSEHSLIVWTPYLYLHTLIPYYAHPKHT